MRRQSLFWGIAITIIGILLLINQIWGFNLFQFMIPIVLIFIGIWFLIVPNTYSRDIKEEHVSIPLESITEADISLQHGAGYLNVRALNNPQELLSGTFDGGVDQTIDQRGSSLKIKLQSPPKILIPHITVSEGLNWNLALSPEIPMILDVKGGASDTMLDLTNLKITDLKLETGASSTDIKMPSNAGYTRTQIHAGAASVNIRIPEGVAAHISTKGSGISDIQVNPNRFPGVSGGFESPDYQTAANKIDISIEVGLGSINIR